MLRLLPSEGEAPGLTDLIEHHIDVQGASPVRHKMRRMSPKILEFVHGEVEKLSRVDMIGQARPRFLGEMIKADYATIIAMSISALKGTRMCCPT